MNGPHLLAAIERWRRPRILILGDFILDQYTWGNADRVSPEAPVLVLQADSSESRLGGAANVAHATIALNAQAICVGVVGNDSEGHLLLDLLQDSGVDTTHVVHDPSRPTTSKERFIGRASTRHPSQILRVDRESKAPLAPHLEEEILARIRAAIENVDVILISDYGKGVCTETVVTGTIDLAIAASKPVLVDPQRGANWHVYRGATLLKANRNETAEHLRIHIQEPADAVAACETLCKELELHSAMTTLDRDGMAISSQSGEQGVFATQAKSVYDITGAGDVVLAVLGVSLASGQSLSTATQIANIAAGIKVGRFGASVVTREEIVSELRAHSIFASAKIVNLKEAAEKAKTHRARGEKLVMTNGCYDLLHVGHVTSLMEAANMGDALLVAINSDASVRRLKGPSRPVIEEQNRAAMLAALDCVDYVLVFDSDTPEEALRMIQPAILAKGGTYKPEEVVGHEIVKGYGGEVRLTGVIEGISTSAILGSLVRNGESAGQPIRRAA